MGEVLSQSEIDNLLKQLNSGELDVEEMKNTEEKTVKDYDFARPAKFSKEHLRTLEIIFEHYGRLLSTNLPAYLRMPVQVEVKTSEAVIYSEFSNALSNPVLLGVVDFEPLDGNIVLEIASNLGFVIIDRLLGGAGKPLSKGRDFSEIELSIIERIFNICVNLLREPWQNVLSIVPRMERIETNSQFAQIISPSEMIAIVTISIKLGDTEGLMNVCLPYSVLEPVMDKLNTKYWFSTMQHRDVKTYEDAISSLISKAQIPVKAVLGNSTISVNDFLNLNVGDIIRLDRKVDEELDVYDDDDTKLSDEELRMDSDKMNTRRMVHMDGIQATAFARVRYGDGKADYGRTERQRKVIEQIVAKAKKFDIGRLNSILTAVTKNISTSFDINEILDLATSITKYKLTMVDGGFPFTRNDQIRSKDGWKFADPVIPVTLESNVVKFHEKLFDSTDYTPSTTVKNISEKIIRLTGVYE